jgi:hypothetical protein
MKRTINLCLRFLAAPLVVAGLLVVVEVAEPAHTVRYVQKLGVALAMYGVGSIIPYFLSDDILNRRFGIVSTEGGYTVSFESTDAKEAFDLVKITLWFLLIPGFILWILNNLLPVRLATSQPTLANWFWISGVAYCLASGAFFVIVSLGPSPKAVTQKGEE